MKLLIHLIAESGVGQHVQEIACLERKEHHLEDVGLTLLEAKKRILGNSSSCPHLSQSTRLKGSHNGEVSNFVW
jgi:hypothetical protein